MRPEARRYSGVPEAMLSARRGAFPRATPRKHDSDTMKHIFFQVLSSNDYAEGYLAWSSGIKNIFEVEMKHSD